jgi:hypothetical protein
VTIEEQKHVALPKLVGQPAYARPSRPVSEAPRPFDPDDLPLTVALNDEERDWVESLPPRAYAPGGGIKIGDEAASRTSAGPSIAGRPFRLRTLAGKLRGTQR